MITEEEKKKKHAERERKYRKQGKHIEREKAWRKEYNDKNKDRIRATHKKYYENNKDRCRALKKRWVANNQEKNRASVKKARGNIRSWFWEYKSTLKCSRCFESDPICLEFHHNGTGEKEINVSIMVVNGMSKENIFKEINKCTVLCANCHRKEHRDIFGRIR